MRWTVVIIVGIVCASMLIAALVTPLRARVLRAVRPRASVADRMNQYGETARARLRSDFESAGVPYPPTTVVFLVVKSSRTMEVHASSTRDGTTHRVRTLPITGMSGTLGPKLREGDRQVPEGLYGIESLNPNSLYHLALRVSYPNAEDRAHAEREGRTQLGGDIMIHGGSMSIGCLALGDDAAEDLFVLAADVGIEHVEVVLSPVDFRNPETVPPASSLPWMKARYEQLAQRMSSLRP